MKKMKKKGPLDVQYLNLHMGRLKRRKTEAICTFQTSQFKTLKSPFGLGGGASGANPNGFS